MTKERACCSRWPTGTLDTRQVNLMPVTPEFVAAQVGG